ncbi:MAG TPA: tRNA dihydrouridine synthase DusB [Aestuariivirgaceae bacterium]|jgi:nifR3 family TIM-barrel protein
MGIKIGPLTTRSRVFLAPMSGITDEPFRALAHELKAALVVSEMVASEDLVRERPDVVRRARGAGRISPFVIQLAGREARWMAEGAKLAQGLGADVIDINMGCPAREVTGGLSGSALMRDLDHAQRLIAATVAAVTVPVTVKMRLGWDDAQRNAPELARRAEAEGVSLLAIHGRTRCQFYKGRADWRAIKEVRDAVGIPLIANGDLRNESEAGVMLEATGADGLMVGRGACGRPWAPALLAEAIDRGSGRSLPTLAEQRAIALRHYEAMLSHYGTDQGVRVARKHLGWYVEDLKARNHLSESDAKSWRQALVGETTVSGVRTTLNRLYDTIAAVQVEAA